MLDKVKEEIKSLKAEIENMNKELKIKDAENVEQDKYVDLLSDLFKRGVIDKEWNLIDND